MNKKRINVLISLILGIGIFAAIIIWIGPESLKVIIENSDPIWIIPYVIMTTALFLTIAWRIQIILKAYDKKVPFWTLFRQGLAGYSVSYVTPSARIGGEPLKVYMLKKEADIGYKLGSSAVIIDKFVELLGSAVLGLVGLILVFFVPGISMSIKLTLGIILAISFALLFFVYYWTIKGKGPFTYLSNLFRLYKFKKWKKVSHAIKDVEEKMDGFFKKHKKAFFLSFFAYILFGVGTIIEVKLMFLIFGINLPVIEVILAIVLLGVINFIPVPAGVGFHEAGQVGLFSILKGAGGGGIGLAFALLQRIRGLIFVAIGFGIISHFGGKQILKKYTMAVGNENSKKKKKK